MADKVAYEPVDVKALLAEMKDTAELLVDLSYSAVLLGDEAVAAEVLALEEQMDVLQLRARMSVMLACRSPEDAETLAPVLGMVGAAEKISNAAGDIAGIVLSEVGLPEAMRATLPEAVETVVAATATADAPLVGRTLGEADVETETGVRVVAVRRAGDWLLDPGADATVRTGDTLLLRGPEDGLAAVHPEVTGEPYAPPSVPDPELPDLERAVDSIVLMKDMAELAVDLAYGAVLFDSDGVAGEVLELEAEVDALQSRFEAWVLRAAARVDDPVSLRGLVRLAAATEEISDAALEISEGVLRGLSAHPVVAEAVGASEEVIVRLTVAEGPAAGRTIGDLAVESETGARVVAVRRGERADDEGWVVSPGPDTRLAVGDVLLATGTPRSTDRLAALVDPY